MPPCSIRYMKFLFELAQLRAAVVFEKVRAKYTLLIVWHLQLFVQYFNCNCLFFNLKLRLCSSADTGIILNLFLLSKNEPRVLIKK